MFIPQLNSVLTKARQALVSPSHFRHMYKPNRVKNEPYWNFQVRNFAAPPGSPGSGAGKGGGGGGSVRDAGGGLGKFGAAQEEGYFYDKTKEQLKKMKKKLKDKPSPADKQDDK